MKKPDVLVLNKGYVPVHIIDWTRAMSLIYQQHARPLDRDLIVYNYNDWVSLSNVRDDYPYVKTIHNKIFIPEIIVLKEFNRLPLRDVKYSRQTLFQRDHFKCAYCGKKFDKNTLTIDHVIPRHLGGKTTWENTVTACRECNFKKGGKLLSEINMQLLIPPKKPRWISPVSGNSRHYECKSWLLFLDKTLIDND